MNERILLVDDNEDFLDSTKDVLELEGFDVYTASSGEEAVMYTGTQSFDIILMDIKMPGMNGVESFIEIKKQNPGVKVIMVTAYSVKGLMQQALREGAIAVLQKPVELDRLFKSISDAINNGKGGLILVADDDKELCLSLIHI